MTDSVLLCYPGHQGATARAHFGQSPRAMVFEAGQVRPVPAAEAGSLVRLGGYVRAEPMDAVLARYGVAGEIDGLTMATCDGAPVVVLDDPTRAVLLAARRAAAGGEEPAVGQRKKRRSAAERGGES